MNHTGSLLALKGGRPLRSTRWPRWPQYGPTATRLLQHTLQGGRWAVSGEWTGEPPLDSVFAAQFSAFLGVKYCVPTDHGTSALVLTLKALGVGAGDEVIVPGLTWVACASSVLQVGAIPILVDVEPHTLCLSPAAVAEAITPRTAAVMVVHLYSAMAEMDELIHLSRKHALAIIEDCAQAHGARWRGRVAGSLTEVGAFSMQQGKVLTCGEGGAAVTSDAHLYSLLEQLRNDGRRYAATEPTLGQTHLKEVGQVIGSNHAMSEFQAALLLDGLSRLGEQNQRRKSNAEYLDSKLAALGGIEIIRPHPHNDARSYYYYVVRYEASEFAGRNVGVVCQALEAELGCRVQQTYPPLNQHPLYRPQDDPRFAVNTEARRRLDPTRYELPEATRQQQRSILFHHSILLGTLEDMDDIVAAFDKVKRLSHTLPTS